MAKPEARPQHVFGHFIPAHPEHARGWPRRAIDHALLERGVDFAARQHDRRSAQHVDHVMIAGRPRILRPCKSPEGPTGAPQHHVIALGAEIATATTFNPSLLSCLSSARAGGLAARFDVAARGVICTARPVVP